jgi:DNA-binding ferritin-like protein
VEISVLTELWWGLPHKSYSRSRGWTDEHLDAAADRLRADGYLAGAELTDAGRELRRRVEADTDRQDEPMVRALGDDAEELFAILEPWRDALFAGFGYPATAFQTAADL